MESLGGGGVICIGKAYRGGVGRYPNPGTIFNFKGALWCILLALSMFAIECLQTLIEMTFWDRATFLLLTGVRPILI